MAEHRSLQERLAPRAVCFGCGPANRDGLHLRSFVAGEPGAPAWGTPAMRDTPTADGTAGPGGGNADRPQGGPRDAGAGPALEAIPAAAPSTEPAPELVAEWEPAPRFEAFEGALNGGVIGTLLDCHSNWAATYALMRQAGAGRPPSTVTAEYTVRMRRPTPTRLGPIRLRAKVVDLRRDRAVVESTLEAGGDVCVSFRGTFVAVGPGHPAHGRW